MRMLFNHGFTPEELYVNTPKKITDKHWRWFIKYYGFSSSYGDSLADPFKYAWYLILNKIINDKMRFKPPVQFEAYIDFEIVTGDNFESQRQNGRFQHIDFIESDFTGYGLKYYFKAKDYPKSYPIYLGGELKRLFTEKINSGEKFYSIKDFTLKDIIEPIYERFKELSKKEVKGLITLGFKRLHSAFSWGCSATINTTKFGEVYAHIGSLSLSPAIQIKQYSLRRDKKYRLMEKWKQDPFDGYYYIGLNPKQLQEWVELNKKSRVLVTFKGCTARKIKKEWDYKNKQIYVFRVNVKEFKGWSYWCELKTYRDVLYMGEVNNLKFHSSNKTWKDLIREYEKGSS